MASTLSTLSTSTLKPADMSHGTRVNKTEEQWAAMKGFSGTVLGQ